MLSNEVMCCKYSIYNNIIANDIAIIFIYDSKIGNIKQ